MARNRNAENPVRAATQRKWYARAWWVGIHVYGYVVLGVKGALSPQALPTAQFVVYLVVAVVTIGCYLVLQLSSPGQLDKRPLLAPVQVQSPAPTPQGVGSPRQLQMEDGDDTELLADGLEDGHPRDSADLHFCSECHVFQPLRTKHWYSLDTKATVVEDLTEAGTCCGGAAKTARDARGNTITSTCSLWLEVDGYRAEAAVEWRLTLCALAVLLVATAWGLVSARAIAGSSCSTCSCRLWRAR
jgi:hypothetical protein